MKHEIDNNVMWAAFRQELALQGELQVVAAIDNALNNLGFTIEETSTIVPIPLKQGEKKAKYHDVCDKCVRQPTCQSDCFLQQGEQKPDDNIDSSSFKDKLLKLFQKFRYIKEGMPTNGDIIDYVDAHIQELIDTIQNKPAWSEEDEKLRIQCLDLITNFPSPNGKIDWTGCQNWLKSLKPQPKQEWSEEDKKMYQRVLSFAESEWGSDYDLVIWLKSLRPQSHWRPSDEQMYDLSEAAHYNCAFFDMEILKELYDDLKKLREE